MVVDMGYFSAIISKSLYRTTDSFGDYDSKNPV